MGLRISNLITCELCARYNDGVCSSHSEDAAKLFRVKKKDSAQSCPEFINSKETISGEIRLQEALRFMLAGESEFVLLSCKTNRKFRYKLDKKEQFIYWLNTSESNGVFTYAGVLFFDENDNTFKFGKGARGNLTKDDLRVISLLYVLNHLVKNRFDMPLKIYHVGKCGRCGKKLTDPTSILTGLGPICAKQSGVPMIEYKGE